VKPKHLLQAASACRRALAPFVKDDWGAVQAGGLTWDVRQTVTHVCDAVGWYAAHLALRSPPRLRFELVDAYDTDATDLAETAGLRDRMTRRQVDIAATPDEVDAHDIVVLTGSCAATRPRASPDRGSRPCQATAGVQPPTPQLDELDVHPLAERRFRLIGKSFPGVRPSPSGPGRRRRPAGSKGSCTWPRRRRKAF
jgi:hypothetical protein